LSNPHEVVGYFPPEKKTPDRSKNEPGDHHSRTGVERAGRMTVAAANNDRELFWQPASRSRPVDERNSRQFWHRRNSQHAAATAESSPSGHRRFIGSARRRHPLRAPTDSPRRAAGGLRALRSPVTGEQTAIVEVNIISSRVKPTALPPSRISHAITPSEVRV